MQEIRPSANISTGRLRMQLLVLFGSTFASSVTSEVLTDAQFVLVESQLQAQIQVNSGTTVQLCADGAIADILRGNSENSDCPAFIDLIAVIQNVGWNADRGLAALLSQDSGTGNDSVCNPGTFEGKTWWCGDDTSIEAGSDKGCSSGWVECTCDEETVSASERFMKECVTRNSCNPGTFRGKTWLCANDANLNAGAGKSCSSEWEECCVCRTDVVCNPGTFEGKTWWCAANNNFEAGTGKDCPDDWVECCSDQQVSLCVTDKVCNPGTFEGKTWWCADNNYLEAGDGKNCPSDWVECCSDQQESLCVTDKFCNPGTFEGKMWWCPDNNYLEAGAGVSCLSEWIECCGDQQASLCVTNRACNPGTFEGKTWWCPDNSFIEAGAGVSCPNEWVECCPIGGSPVANSDSYIGEYGCALELVCNPGVFEGKRWWCKDNRRLEVDNNCLTGWMECCGVDDSSDSFVFTTSYGCPIDRIYCGYGSARTTRDAPDPKCVRNTIMKIVNLKDTVEEQCLAETTVIDMISDVRDAYTAVVPRSAYVPQVGTTTAVLFDYSQEALVVGYRLACEENAGVFQEISFEAECVELDSSGNKIKTEDLTVYEFPRCYASTSCGVGNYDQVLFEEFTLRTTEDRNHNPSAGTNWTCSGDLISGPPTGTEGNDIGAFFCKAVRDSFLRNQGVGVGFEKIKTSVVQETFLLGLFATSARTVTLTDTDSYATECIAAGGDHVVADASTRCTEKSTGGEKLFNAKDFPICITSEECAGYIYFGGYLEALLADKGELGSDNGESQWLCSSAFEPSSTMVTSLLLSTIGMTGWYTF